MPCAGTTLDLGFHQRQTTWPPAAPGGRRR